VYCVSETDQDELGVDKCKPLPGIRPRLHPGRGVDDVTEQAVARVLHADHQGLTLGHVTAELDQLQDTFMRQLGSYDGQKCSS